MVGSGSSEWGARIRWKPLVLKHRCGCVVQEQYSNSGSDVSKKLGAVQPVLVIREVFGFGSKRYLQ